LDEDDNDDYEWQDEDEEEPEPQERALKHTGMLLDHIKSRE